MDLKFWLELVILVAVLGKCFTMFVFPRILSRWLTLNHKMTSEEGYVAVPDLSSLQGCEGIAVTDLLPSGKADIGSRKLDVSIRQGIVKKGTRVRIVEVCAGNLYVEAVPTPDREIVRT